MSKELEYIQRHIDIVKQQIKGSKIKFTVTDAITKHQYDYYENELQTLESIEKALHRLESIDNAEPSEALECLERIGAEKLARGELIRNDDKVEPYYNTIKQALLKQQEPKQYLKWENIDFSYGTKVRKVRMADTIYKIEYVYYDNVKEVKLLSEDEKWFYLSFAGNYEDNVQLFNDLHLERVEENE